MDLAALGGEMAERKQELIDENGGSEERRKAAPAANLREGRSTPKIARLER